MARKIIVQLVIVIVLASSVVPIQPVLASPAASAPDCRFGITVANWAFMKNYVPNESVARYDLPLVGVGYYLDWSFNRNASVPGYINFTHVLNVRDDLFAPTLASLPSLVTTYPGAIWIIGNEPDSPVDQDNTTAETYADRFYAYATYIKAHDANARVSFGTITMATKTRMRFMDYAWAQLVKDAGSEAAASNLIDIWTPHGFILNEQEGSWGAGIPPAISTAVHNEYVSLQEPIGGSDIYSFAKFTERIIRYRTWLKAHNQQNKPMWLTEFGNLLPPYNSPGGNSATAPDPITPNFIKQTFDWMYSYKDATIGNPNDGNRLTQKWFWYSLNDLVTHFGGTLIDPVTRVVTASGIAFETYDPPFDASVTIPAPALGPISLKIYPVSRNANNHNLVDYTLVARVRNNTISDFRSDATVKVYEGTTLIGTASGKVERCGGDGLFTFHYPGILPGSQHTLTVVVTATGGTGGQQDYPESTAFTVPIESFVPVVKK
jgi:hypothetical protein